MNDLSKFRVQFPLTLTLSLGEREQQADTFGDSESLLANPVARFSKRLRAILPLPEVEGRGEGKGDFICFVTCDCLFLPSPSAGNNLAMDAEREVAIHARSFLESLLFLDAAANSKTAKLSLQLWPTTRRVPHLFSFVPDGRAVNRPVQYPETPRRRKNPKCIRQKCVAGEI